MVDEYVINYSDEMSNLVSLEKIEQIQEVIDRVNNQWLSHQNALAEVINSINNDSSQKITIEVLDSIIGLTFNPEYIEEYNKKINNSNELDGLEGLQSLISLVDKELTEKGKTENVWEEGVFFPSEFYRNLCDAPRSGIDEHTGTVYPDNQGSILQEQLYLRSIHNEEYLWYDEIIDSNPSNFSSTSSYFNSLKTPFTLADNRPKDRFHFSQTYDDYMSNFAEKVLYGFGFNWSFLSSYPPRNLVLTYVDEYSIAGLAGISRGDRLVKINNIDVINTTIFSDLVFINEVLFNTKDGLYLFEFHSPLGAIKQVLMSPTHDVANPLMFKRQLVTSDDRIGYFMLNEFHASAQSSLISTFNEFLLDGVNELIVDLRYNRGGLLYMSSQLAYMIAGAKSSNRIFESLIYNDKSSHKNFDLMFVDREIDWSQGIITNEMLPTLNLDRVFILATGSTASASESLINGLRGIDVEVVLIGSQTYGKPYGFVPNMNCGMAYYFVQFVGQNEKGFGDYTYGLEPVEFESSEIGLTHRVKGCAAIDDVTLQLGSYEEPMVSDALSIIEKDQCHSSISSLVTTLSNRDVQMSSSASPNFYNQKVYEKLYPLPPWL
ncbi:Peptidase family S41 [Vibrio thalassae]|uniref:Peptidase family S41 n=1 Tax=Vibrio thalassae TaxID=1243014 RepID=A0A240ENW5_9VIBR|nr:S41 family peptidase [Vibrio thalassae]SNX49913.1 Peptidase family S41 [Vibrio thalassae]